MPHYIGVQLAAVGRVFARLFEEPLPVPAVRIPLPTNKRPPAPIVAQGAGDTLSDASSEKLARQWIAALDHDAQSADARLFKFLFGPLGRFGGTPKSQMKWINRVTQALGKTALRASISPGKRANMYAVFDRTVVGPAYNASETSSNAWLLVERFWVRKEAPRSRLSGDMIYVAAFTKHAVVRLIQRAGVHTVEELQGALRTLWSRVAVAELATRGRREKARGEQWLVPIQSGVEGEPMVAVVRGPSPTEPEYLFYVATVMPWSYVRDDAKPAVLELDGFLQRHGLSDAIELRPTFERLFDAVRGA